jgi:sulfatase modifying factor 1
MKNIIYQVLFLLFFPLLSFSQEQVKLLTSTKFNNGEQIPEAKTASEWEQLSMSNQPVFMKKVIVGKEYFFYNWYAISDKRQLVDEKWMIPNSNELLIWNAYSPISVQPIGIISEQGAFSKVAEQQYFWTCSEYTDKGKRESAISASISKTTIGETSLNQAYKQEGFLVLIVEREAIKVASKTLVETYLKSKKSNEPIKTVVSSSIPNTIKESNKSIEATNKPTIQWVTIPAGTFTMGSPSSEVSREGDEIQHEVTLGAFKMSAYEVTFEQYDAFCEAKMRAKPNDQGWGRGKRPVINVSWDDATAFAEWMGCRLPTEAEWEYACRSGSTTPFNTGTNLTTAQANYDGNYPYNNKAMGIYREQTTLVGSFIPNTWGLYDMHGNVFEWCSDWFGSYPSYDQTNPTGINKSFNRVCRGGSWLNDAQDCRSASRRSNTSNNSNYSIGFRLVSSE